MSQINPAFFDLMAIWAKAFFLLLAGVAYCTLCMLSVMAKHPNASSSGPGSSGEVPPPGQAPTKLAPETAAGKEAAIPKKKTTRKHSTGELLKRHGRTNKSQSESAVGQE